jgi:ElaB/YqjD/DUF883 family membrane-anchored ribosome-binding protein
VLDAAKTAGRQVGAVARDEAANLRQELDDLVSRIPGMSQAAVNEAKEAFLVKVETTRASARDMKEAMRVQLEQRMDSTAEYVRAQPFRALGMSLGVGIVLGWLMSRGNGRGDDR